MEKVVKRPAKSTRKYTRKKKAEAAVVADKEAEVAAASVDCKFCGAHITDPEHISGKKCIECVAMEQHLPKYLELHSGSEYVKHQLRMVVKAASPDNNDALRKQVADALKLVEHIKGQLKEKNARLHALESKNHNLRLQLSDVRKKIKELRNLV